MISVLVSNSYLWDEIDTFVAVLLKDFRKTFCLIFVKLKRGFFLGSKLFLKVFCVVKNRTTLLFLH